MSLGKSDPPDPPDYRGAAREQGEQNLLAARASGKLSNPTIISPLGRRDVQFGTGSYFDQTGYDAAVKAYEAELNRWSNAGQPQAWGNPGLNDPMAGGYSAPSTPAGPRPVSPDYSSFWRTSGDPDSVTITETMSPEMQALFDQQMRISQKVGSIGEEGLGRVEQAFGTPFSLGSADDAERAAMDAYLARLRPQLDVMRRGREAQLANQGIGLGSDAYTESQRILGQQENDALSQAVLAAYGMRPQVIQEELALRNQPLAELNALRSGAQPTLPQFQPYQGVNVAPAPIMAGALAQGQADANMWSAGQAQNQGLMSGIFGLGSAALLGGVNPFSFGGAAAGGGGAALGSGITPPSGFSW